MKKLLMFILIFIGLGVTTGCKHQHTYDDYLVYEQGHFHPYNCGCPQPDVLEGHRDSDNDGICDECKYVLNIKEG